MPTKTGPALARSLDTELLRRALGQYATGVTVVTALAGDTPIGMTANSFTSVSLAPPLILWCVAKTAASHDLFVAAPHFAVHVLGARHGDLALAFAGKRGEKFAGVDWQPGVAGVPVLREVAPIFECRTWARYPGGDHTIIVGEVLELMTRPGDPLLFHSGELRGLSPARKRVSKTPRGA